MVKADSYGSGAVTATSVLGMTDRPAEMVRTGSCANRGGERPQQRHAAAARFGAVDGEVCWHRCDAESRWTIRYGALLGGTRVGPCPDRPDDGASQPGLSRHLPLGSSDGRTGARLALVKYRADVSMPDALRCAVKREA